MSTRGAIGFRKNNSDKLTYNHYDSYPSGLGEEIVDFIKNTSIEEMNKLFDELKLINLDYDMQKGCLKLNQQEIDILKFFIADERQIYGLNDCIEEYLYRLNNNPLFYYKHESSIKEMVDNNSFIKDSLFCEYGYIINLDTNKLEIWKGFQKKPDSNNRYGVENVDGYYPCKMIKEISFSYIKTNRFSLEKSLGKKYS